MAQQKYEYRNYFAISLMAYQKNQHQEYNVKNQVTNKIFIYKKLSHGKIIEKLYFFINSIKAVYFPYIPVKTPNMKNNDLTFMVLT